MSSPSTRFPRVPNPRSQSRSSQCARSSSVMTPKFKRSPRKSVSAGPTPYFRQINNAQMNPGIEPHQIAADGWAVGYDDRFPKHQRLQQALLFARFSEHENLYAHPLVNFCSFAYPLHLFFDCMYSRISFQSLTRCQKKSSRLTFPRDIGTPPTDRPSSPSRQQSPFRYRMNRLPSQIENEYRRHSLRATSFPI